MSDPDIREDRRKLLVSELMTARRAVAAARRSGDGAAADDTHAAVDVAKHALGERGPVWWTDGAPDLNRHLARNTPYADWFSDLDAEPPSRSTPELNSFPTRAFGRRADQRSAIHGR